LKITRVIPNNRKRAFEVYTRSGNYSLPYAEVRPSPTSKDKIVEVRIDREMGNEGFVFVLESGQEGGIHIDHVLEYNRDPKFAADLLLYKLTLKAQEAIVKSSLSTREMIRRLGTSPSQFYRLLDQTNYRKSMGQLLSLLHLLNYDVDVVVQERVETSGGYPKLASKP
jgi:hypothetical protein